MRASKISLSCFVVAFCGSVTAQIPSVGIDDFRQPPDAHWAAIASKDVEAAYKLLLQNHPGAAPSLHDDGFVHRLNDAHARAAQRAQTVSSYQGYIFALAGFANDMGDRHIWSRPLFANAYPFWAGIILSKRGDAYVVADTDEEHSGLRGAQLVSCDAVPAAELARKNLAGFRADWSIGAQQVQAAPWLLIDEQNPFIERPSVCLFQPQGNRQSVTLHWQRIRRETLLPRLKSAIGAGAAGFGVRKVGSGEWVALQSLSAPQTEDVTKAVEAQKQALRDAPFVVLDVRGNGGGSSEVGRQIAESLMGKEFVKARLGEESQSNCGGADGAWRTSADNIADMEYLLSTVLAGGSESRRIFSEVLRDAKAARARGEEFSASIHCPATPRAPMANQPVSQMHGTLFLLTDNLCFSSCLAVTDAFRTLGAVQIGQTSDAATHFTEVRETYLPSGYSFFSTLQSLTDADGPSRFGPFEPAIVYQGDIADTSALEQWVTQIASQKKDMSLGREAVR